MLRSEAKPDCCAAIGHGVAHENGQPLLQNTIGGEQDDAQVPLSKPRRVWGTCVLCLMRASDRGDPLSSPPLSGFADLSTFWSTAFSILNFQPPVGVAREPPHKIPGPSLAMPTQSKGKPAEAKSLRGAREIVEAHCNWETQRQMDDSVHQMRPAHSQATVTKSPVILCVTRKVFC